MQSCISALDGFVQDGNSEETLQQLEELKNAIENDKELYSYIKNPGSIIDKPYHIREAITAYA